MIYNLAIKLAPTYDITIDPLLIENAKVGRAAMLKLGVVLKPSRFGGNLPIGSGNEDDLNDDKFYPEIPNSILSEDNGNILLESDT